MTNPAPYMSSNLDVKKPGKLDALWILTLTCFIMFAKILTVEKFPRTKNVSKFKGPSRTGFAGSKFSETVQYGTLYEMKLIKLRFSLWSSWNLTSYRLYGGTSFIGLWRHNGIAITSSVRRIDRRKKKDFPRQKNKQTNKRIRRMILLYSNQSLSIIVYNNNF